MIKMMFTISSEKRNELIDITDRIAGACKGVKEGTCTVFTSHATAAITVIENYDPNICDDFLDALSEQIPQGKWRHDKIDGNGDAHIKAAVIGPSETFIIEEGKLILGTWQSIVLCEFDGPRTDRHVHVKILKEV